MSNQSMLTKRAAGLFNNTNNFETPPGSLTVADNVIINKPNLIEKRFGFDSCSTGLPAGLPLQMFTAQNKLFVHSGSSVYVKDSNCNYSKIGGQIGNTIRPADLQVSGNTIYVIENILRTLNIRYINPNTNTITTIKRGIPPITSPYFVNNTVRYIDGNIMYYSGAYSDFTFFYITLRSIDLTTGADSFIAGGKYGHADGTGAAAQFMGINAILTDSLNIYTMSQCAVRKIVKSTGVVTTIIGNGTLGFADGTGAAASLNCYGMETDGVNWWTMQAINLGLGFPPVYYRLRKIDPIANSITTISATNQQIPTPDVQITSGLGVNGTYVYAITGQITNPPTYYQVVRCKKTDGIFEYFAGPYSSTPVQPGYVDAVGSEARFAFDDIEMPALDGINFFSGRVVCYVNNVYVPDAGNNAIRVIDENTKNVTTFIGGQSIPASTDGSFPPITIIGPS